MTTRRCYKLKYLYLLIITLISGCQTVPAYYNKSGVDDGAMSVIEVKNSSAFHKVMITKIAGVYTSNREKVIGYTSTFEQNEWDSIQLEPGEYIVRASCETTNKFSFPRINIKVKPSTKYILKCKRNFKKNVFGIREIKSFDVKVKSVPYKKS